MHRLALLGLAGLLWCLAQSLALAAASSGPGTAVAVDPSADDTFGSSSRTLVVGSDVSVGDTVVTGPTGQVQLLFKDQTRLAIGPNSSLLIEAYLLKQDQTVGQFTINALSGTFRFITGKSAKDAYQIKTAMGMIGVRGTAFDFISKPDFGTTIVLFHGAVNACNRDSKCVDLTQTCGVASVAGKGSQLVSRAQQLRDNLRSQFGWIRSDAKLMADFKVEQSKGCLAAATVPVIKPTPKPKPRTLVHRNPTTPAFNEPPTDLVLPVEPNYPVYEPPHRHRPPTIYCRPGMVAVERDGKMVCVNRLSDPSTDTLSTPPSDLFTRSPG
jgi:hypothetical protein